VRHFGRCGVLQSFTSQNNSILSCDRHVEQNKLVDDELGLYKHLYHQLHNLENHTKSIATRTTCLEKLSLESK
jgi:hypothetical protein